MAYTHPLFPPCSPGDSSLAVRKGHDSRREVEQRNPNTRRYEELLAAYFNQKRR